MLLTQILKRASQFYPKNIATIDGEHRQTYGELAKRVTALAAALQGLGIRSNDRVAMLMLNGHEFAEVIFACWEIGAVAVPLNYRLAAEELIFIINDAECKAMISDDVMLPMTTAMRPRLEGIENYISTAKADDSLYYEELLASSDSDVTPVVIGENDLAGLFYTSGTTGLPKGVMLSHRNLWMNLMQGMAEIPTSSSDIYLHAAPMFHLADFPTLMSFTMRGATQVTLKKFEPTALLNLLEKEKVSRVMLVPTMINFLVSHPEISHRDLSHLEYITYGASPMPLELLKRSMATLPHVKFVQGYGQSEASPLLTYLKDCDHVADGTEHQLQRLTSCGQAVVGVEIAIFDEHDNPVPSGVVGEIVARGPNVMVGYWKRPEETAKTLRGGWLHTGDAGKIDEDGYVFIVDRTKDMIVTGGENVYSTEVENAIYKHSSIREASVVGIPDEKWGEAVAAIVTLRPDTTLTAEELIAHCNNFLANYKVPKVVEVREGELPKGGTGKIDKKILREKYWEGYTRRVN